MDAETGTNATEAAAKSDAEEINLFLSKNALSSLTNFFSFFLRDFGTLEFVEELFNNFRISCPFFQKFFKFRVFEGFIN